MCLIMVQSFKRHSNRTEKKKQINKRHIKQGKQTRYKKLTDDVSNFWSTLVQWAHLIDHMVHGNFKHHQLGMQNCSILQLHERWLLGLNIGLLLVSYGQRPWY